MTGLGGIIVCGRSPDEHVTSPDSVQASRQTERITCCDQDAGEVMMIIDIETYQAVRAYCRDALIGHGQPTELAERWCDAWETHAALHRRERSVEFWEDGRRWIEARIGAGEDMLWPASRS